MYSMKIVLYNYRIYRTSLGEVQDSDKQNFGTFPGLVV